MVPQERPGQEGEKLLLVWTREWAVSAPSFLGCCSGVPSSTISADRLETFVSKNKINGTSCFFSPGLLLRLNVCNLLLERPGSCFLSWKGRWTLPMLCSMACFSSDSAPGGSFCKEDVMLLLTGIGERVLNRISENHSSAISPEEQRWRFWYFHLWFALVINSCDLSLEEDRRPRCVGKEKWEFKHLFPWRVSVITIDCG